MQCMFPSWVAGDAGHQKPVGYHRGEYSTRSRSMAPLTQKNEFLNIGYHKWTFGLTLSKQLCLLHTGLLLALCEVHAEKLDRLVAEMRVVCYPSFCDIIHHSVARIASVSSSALIILQNYDFSANRKSAILLFKYLYLRHKIQKSLSVRPTNLSLCTSKKNLFMRTFFRQALAIMFCDHCHRGHLQTHPAWIQPLMQNWVHVEPPAHRMSCCCLESHQFHMGVIATGIYLRNCNRELLKGFHREKEMSTSIYLACHHRYNQIQKKNYCIKGIVSNTCRKTEDYEKPSLCICIVG